MALGAGDPGTLGRSPVTAQGVAGQIVREAGPVDHGERAGGSVVLRMAAAAGGGRPGSDQTAVEAVAGLDLGIDIRVAGQASVGHGLRAPGGGVTGAAITGQLSVTRDAAQGLGPGLRVQGPGAEQDRAVSQRPREHPQEGEGGYQDPRGGHESEAGAHRSMVA